MQALVETIRQEIPELAGVYVFGSQASGSTHPDSDLDLAILAGARQDPAQLWELAQRLAVSAGNDVDLIDLRAASTVMRMQVVSGGKRLFCSDTVACERFEDLVYSEFVLLNEERAGILDDIRRRQRVYG